MRLARPTLTIKATRSEADLPVGVSKFGGLPDLPREVEWPRADRVLGFVGQLNLAELPDTPACRELPRQGLLSLFYDNYDYDEDGWHVLFTPDPSGAERRPAPDELLEENRFHPAGLTFAETLSLPAIDSPWSEELALTERWKDYLALTDETWPLHQLLGYPRPIQCDVLRSKTVRHLLTIDSDEAPGWMWGDAGNLFFTIDETDLKAGRLDRAHCEMQCC